MSSNKRAVVSGTDKEPSIAARLLALLPGAYRLPLTVYCSLISKCLA